MEFSPLRKVLHFALFVFFASIFNVSGTCVSPPPDLVSWWQGNGNASDQLGGNTGTLTGNTTYSFGEVDLCFNFDGNSDAVQLGAATNLQLQNFTFEAWIKRSSTSVSSLVTPDAELFCYGSGGYGFGMWSDGTLFLTKADVDNLTSGAQITDMNWHHVAITKTNNTVVFYVDGVAYAAPSYGSTFVFTTPVAIGARGDNLNNSFYGFIDELSVYSRALSSSEIQTIYAAGVDGKCTTPSAPSILLQPANQTAFVGDTVTFSVLASGTGPLSYQWTLNTTNIDGATNSSLVLTNVQLFQAGNYAVIITNVINSTVSSNANLVVTVPTCTTVSNNLVSWWRAENNAADEEGGNNGVLYNDVTYGTGKVGQDFVFDGNGDGIALGNPVSLRLQNFTFEAWIKRSSTSVSSLVTPDAELFCYGHGGYGFGMWSDGTLFLTKGDFDNLTSGAQITDMNWHHVAITKTNNTVLFYVDGVAYAAPSYGSTFVFTTPVAIGARGDNLNNSFYGAIDELSVYNRALSGSEIQAIFGAATAGKCLLEIPPFITVQPTNQTVRAGTNVMLTVSAGGRQPITYLWYFNGTNLPGATNSSIIFSNVVPANSGTYSVALTNAFGYAVSSNAVLRVNVVFAFGNNQPLPLPTSYFTNSVTINLQNAYTNGSIFYTLDGSQPTFASTPYSGPFTLTETAVLRAIGYSADFLVSGETDPFNIVVVPSYSLSVLNVGGGTVSRSPVLAQYPSNTVVNLTATPSSGWMFLKWLGDAIGTNPVTTVSMTRNKQVQPIFGTTLSTTIAGSGSILLQPLGGIYPYGTTVTLTAIPQPGYYFGVWGNAASGNTNPLSFAVVSANPTVSSLFVPLGGGQVALTVVCLGGGHVDVNPKANVYNAGDNINLAAVPDSGQSFNGWTGDMTSSQNPLNLQINQSTVIYANFTQRPKLSGPILDTSGFQFTLSGNYGAHFGIERSANLLDWSTLSTLTNTFGTAQFLDPAGTNLPPNAFYRSVVLP